MDPEFWHHRWQVKQIGFHQHAVHAQLQHHGPRLAKLGQPARVLVPLCGKSLDMQHLRQLGCEVLGVELSEVAARGFFEEARQTPVVSTPGDGFTHYQADGITILCGDMFDLTPERAAPLHAVYDRAALVALPEPMRSRYAKQLTALLPADAQILLVSFDYPQAAMDGPPFSVPQAEVQRLFGDDFDIDLLADEDLLESEDQPGRPSLKGRVHRAQEQTYLLTRGG